MNYNFHINRSLIGQKNVHGFIHLPEAAVVGDIISLRGKCPEVTHCSLDKEEFTDTDYKVVKKQFMSDSSVEIVLELV